MSEEKIEGQENLQDNKIQETSTPAQETNRENQGEHIDIDTGTAFNLKLQEFNKKIAEAEHQVALLKKEKASYIYDQNVQQIVMAHREKQIRAQTEEETRKKLSGQK